MVFEGYNIFLDNWRYVGRPENPWVRIFGYNWSFATIWPAVLETHELLLAFGVFTKVRIRPLFFSNRMRNVFVILEHRMDDPHPFSFPRVGDFGLDRLCLFARAYQFPVGVAFFN